MHTLLSIIREHTAEIASLEAKLADWETCYQNQLIEAGKLQETILAIRVLHAEGTDESRAYLAKNIDSLHLDLPGDMRWSWPSESVPAHELIGE